MDYFILVGMTAVVFVIAGMVFLASRSSPSSVTFDEDGEGAEDEASTVMEKDTTITCQICLGDLSGGDEYSICKCGKTFHTVCVSRTGFCPYCDRPYDDLSFQRENVIGEAHDKELDSCPLCGRAVSSSKCECGAVFSDKEGQIRCPSCGLDIDEDQDVCPRCGETFETVVPRTCPICGGTIHEGQNMCRCGLVMDDLCPECGWRLGEHEDMCPICGLDFELVRSRDELY